MNKLTDYLISFKNDADKLITFNKILESSFRELSTWDTEKIDRNFDKAIRLSYNLGNISSIDIFDEARTTIYDAFLVYVSLLYDSYSIRDAILKEKILNLKDANDLFNSQVPHIKKEASKKAPIVVVEKHIVYINFNLLLREALDLKTYRKQKRHF